MTEPLFVGLLIALGLAAIGLTAVASALGAAVRGVPRQRVRRLVDSGVAGASDLERVEDRGGRSLQAAAFVRALGYAIAVGVGVVLCALVFDGLPAGGAVLIGALVALIATFTFGEALPRAVAAANPEGVGLALAPFGSRLLRGAWPLAKLLSLPWTAIVGLIAHEPGAPSAWVLDEEEGARAGAADRADDEETFEAEEAIADAFSAFREKVVREVMVPRPDMVAIEDDASVADVMALVRKHGFSRIPMFHETLDDIVGVLYVKDLLLALGPDGCTPVSPAAIARPAWFVPESKPVEALLIEMRNRTHIAIVADEYGGTAGLVSIEDLLEEIVGEIFDEYDRREELVLDLGNGRMRVDARLPVDELDELFGTKVDTESDTVGGLFTDLVGHIPTVGESTDVEGLRLTVDAVQGARVRGLLVEPAPRQHKENDDDPAHSA
jgi:CBS domain containing-hemolysin-like protein